MIFAFAGDSLFPPGEMFFLFIAVPYFLFSFIYTSFYFLTEDKKFNKK